MAVVERSDLIQRVTDLIGNDESEESISLLEDLTDTMDSLDGTEWEQKYKDNDASWRKRYRERFLKKPDTEDEELEDEDEDEKTIKMFDDLFKKED